MGNTFWDDNPDVVGGGAGDYVGGDEKQALAESGQPFAITGVKERQAFGNDQYSLSVLIYNEDAGEDEDRIMTFTKGGDHPVESRDEQLGRMVEAFSADPTLEPIWAKLTKAGRAYIIVPAEAPETA